MSTQNARKSLIVGRKKKAYTAVVRKSKRFKKKHLAVSDFDEKLGKEAQNKEVSELHTYLDPISLI